MKDDYTTNSSLKCHPSPRPIPPRRRGGMGRGDGWHFRLYQFSPTRRPRHNNRRVLMGRLSTMPQSKILATTGKLIIPICEFIVPTWIYRFALQKAFTFVGFWHRDETCNLALGAFGQKALGTRLATMCQLNFAEPLPFLSETKLDAGG